MGRMREPIEGEFKVKGGERPGLFEEDATDPHRRAPIDYWIAAILFAIVVRISWTPGMHLLERVFH